MKNRGFTLLELLGVIVILALLTTLVFPSVLNAIKKTSDQTNKLSMDLISNAADMYIENHANDFKKRNGSKFIIDMNELMEDGNLPSHVKISDIDNIEDKCVQVLYTNNNYAYELKDKDSCEYFLALPEEYQQVEYIESTGTQYIDTGYVVQEDDELELTYKLTDLSKDGDKVLLGCNRNETSGLWAETYYITNRWYVRFGSEVSAVIMESNDTQYEGILILKKGEFTINGEKLLSPSFSAMPTTTLNLFGAKVIMNSDYMYGSYAQISNFKITRNSKTIREFIPCYRKSDGVIGMYDLVEDKFYTNSGTGTFKKGKDI